MMHTDKIRPARNGKCIGGKCTAQALYFFTACLICDHALAGKRCQQRMFFRLNRSERTQQRIPEKEQEERRLMDAVTDADGNKYEIDRSDNGGYTIHRVN